MQQRPTTFLSVTIAAQRLGLDPSTLRRLIRQNEVPVYRAGPRVQMIDEADLGKITVRRRGRPRKDARESGRQ